MAAQGFNLGQFGKAVPGWTPASPTSVIGTPFSPGPGSISYRALRLAGYMQQGTLADPEILQDCLDEANGLLDSWNAQQNMQSFIDDRYFALNASQQSFTVGPTGTLNTDINGNLLTYRPQRIVRANLVLINTSGTPVRIPIRIIDVDSYADIPVIAISSQVIIRMYVQTTLNNVTCWMFPFPTVGNQLELFMWPGFAQIPSPGAILMGNPGLEDALVYGLAEIMYMLSPKDMNMAGRAVRYQWLKNKAIEFKRVFEASNAPTPSLTMDLVTQTGDNQGAPFNYLTGETSQ